MQITVLGSGAAFPRPGGACSGYLLRGDGATVWIDAGNGTFSRLRELVDVRDLDALILTHDHADHICDVLPLMYELGYDGHVLPVYANAAVAPKLLGMVGPGSAQIFNKVFDFRPLADPFRVGAMTFTPFRVVHPTETYGLQMTNGAGTAVYTSDTAAFPELADHCRGVDLLVCDSTYVGHVDEDPGVHMWAHEAGELATVAQVKRLVLTHIWPSFDPDDAIREAATAFDGPIEWAAEGTTYTL